MIYSLLICCIPSIQQRQGNLNVILSAMLALVTGLLCYFAHYYHRDLNESDIDELTYGVLGILVGSILSLPNFCCVTGVTKVNEGIRYLIHPIGMMQLLKNFSGNGVHRVQEDAADHRIIRAATDADLGEDIPLVDNNSGNGGGESSSCWPFW
jgi:hypothetical protein